jgi:hypothetical protein
MTPERGSAWIGLAVAQRVSPPHDQPVRIWAKRHAVRRDRLVVRLHFSLLLLMLLVLLLLKIAIRLQVNSAIGLGVLGAGAVLDVLVTFRLFRLTADATGIRVANGFPTSIPWAQVAGVAATERSVNGIRVRRLEITRTDGRVIRPIVPKASIYSGYSDFDLDRIVERLRRMRRQALGGADPPELTDALSAAANGDPGPMDHRLAAHEIEPDEYSERLHELADAGRVDLETLRRARREQP